MAEPSYVVVGAGLAAASAVAELRAQGFEGGVTVVGDEAHRPYERPMLSKDYLQGRAARDEVFVHAPDWYAEHQVHLHLGTPVAALDRAEQQVLLGDGQRIGYDRLLLATGATPRRLAVPGADLAGVHYLRTLDDSTALRTAFAGARRLVVVGAGWIGLETAAAARLADLEVTVLEAAPLPLLAVLGADVAPIVADLHRRHGVDVRCGTTVAELVGVGGAVTGVRLAGGDVVAADLVVVGVGVSAADGLARDAGLRVDDGVLVDAGLRSSDPAVFAAGDVARAHHPLLGGHVRVEHWANARRQGAAAARSMLGQDVRYERLPYFYSDQFDLGMEYTGYVARGASDQVVVRGDPAGGKGMVLWLGRGRVLAGMAVNTWDAMPAVESLVLRRGAVDVRRLADPDVPLAEV